MNPARPLMRSRAELAALANTIDPTLHLVATSTADELAEWMTRNEPDGVYPMRTETEAWAALDQVIEKRLGLGVLTKVAVITVAVIVLSWAVAVCGLIDAVR